MIDGLCSEMFSKTIIAPKFTWWVSYDYKSLEYCPNYDGPVSLDFYGRLHPKHSHGTVKMPMETNSVSTVSPLILDAFDKKTDHRLLYRRLGIAADNVKSDGGFYQLSFLIDYEALEREKRLQGAIGELRSKYGRNVIFKGNNMLEGATQLERNSQIGGHKA